MEVKNQEIFHEVKSIVDVGFNKSRKRDHKIHKMHACTDACIPE